MYTEFISEKRKKLLDDIENSPFKVGDIVEYTSEKNGRKETRETPIIAINGNDITIEAKYNGTEVVNVTSLKHIVLYVGENPFCSDEETRFNRNYNFGLGDILGQLGIIHGRQDTIIKGILVPRCSFNPFVVDKNGKRLYYQRDFCWTLEQKQELIESIYNRLEIGRVVIRKNSWKKIESYLDKGYTDIAHADVVDGKQRLGAIIDFITGKITDKRGNYFGDLSARAQYDLLDSNAALGYIQIGEEASDEYVLKQFLRMNTGGVPQEASHLDDVRKMYENVKK